jgi:hypothetical protein
METPTKARMAETFVTESCIMNILHQSGRGVGVERGTEKIQVQIVRNCFWEKRMTLHSCKNENERKEIRRETSGMNYYIVFIMI